MNSIHKTSLIVAFVAVLLIGFFSSRVEKPLAPQPTVELFVGLPRGLPIACGEAVRTALEEVIESALPGTAMTFFLVDNQELLGTLIIPPGSKAYRKKIALKKLAQVLERLDPELSGGSQAIDLIAIPASIRKYRKTNLPPKVILIGSPLIEDREQGASITKTLIPCDGCVTNPKSSYGKMESFPQGTTLHWLHPRADYGNGPNHRAQIEHFLRYLVQEKKGTLVRLSPDAKVIFNSMENQWDDLAVPEDDCTGLKEVAADKETSVLYDSDGTTRVMRLKPNLSIKVRRPEVGFLKGPTDHVLFLPDISGSIAWDADGNDRSEIFRAIKADLCKKLDTMPFTHFAICGFGGERDLSPRLPQYPHSMLSGFYWAKATRENRDVAIQFVKQLKPGGGTPTLAALQEATRLEGPFACILYSDGVPTLGAGGQAAVLKFAKDLAQKQITLNAVGVGGLSAANDDFDWSGGEFLTRLARTTSGEYFALE